MSSLFGKLTNFIESLDNKAAETAASGKTENDFSIGFFDETGENDNLIDSHDIIEEMRIKSQQEQEKMIKIESQLQEYTDDNNRTENAIMEEVSKSKKNLATFYNLQRELVKVKAELDEKARTNIEQDFGNTDKFEEILNNLKNDYENLILEKKNIEKEIQTKKYQIKEIQKSIDEKNEVIKSLDADLVETRSKAINELTDSIKSPEMLDKIDEFERKRAELKESIQKDQQKVTSLQASIRELQEESGLEMKEANKATQRLQTELFKLRTENEAVKHEIELTNENYKKELIDLEQMYKNQLENEEKTNKKEIERLQFHYESETNNNDRNISLIRAQNEINQLLLRKNELTRQIESRNNSSKSYNPQHKNESKNRFVKLTSILPRSTPDSIYIQVEKFDKIDFRISRFYAIHPIQRSLLILWFITCNLILLIFLFI